MRLCATYLVGEPDTRLVRINLNTRRLLPLAFADPLEQKDEGVDRPQRVERRRVERVQVVLASETVRDTQDSPPAGP